VLFFFGVRAFKPPRQASRTWHSSLRAPLASSPSDSDVTREDVSRLKARVERLAKYESEYLLPFWSEEKKCFQVSVTAGTAERVSVTSTCSVVDLILKNKQHWKNHVSWEGRSEVGSDISLEAITASLLGTQWSFDDFQAPALLRTLAAMRAVNPATCEKYQKLVDTVLEQRSRLSLHRKQKQSSYLRYTNSIALLSMVKHNMVPPKLQDTNEVSYALERANLVAYDEVSRQLAFWFSGDSSAFDVIVLAFSLLTYYETAESQYFIRSGVLGSANVALVRSALKVIFDAQFKDGTWRKGEAIKTKGGTNAKRDIGNSYVFFFDIVSGLIKALPQELLMPYTENLERCVDWAEKNVQKEMAPVDCDDSGLCQGPVIMGWKSNHVAEPATTSWSTCSVFNFLDELKDWLDVAQTSSVLKEFNGKGKEAVLLETGGRESWHNLMDADLGGNKRKTMKNVLFEEVLLPHLVAEVEDKTVMLPPWATQDLMTLGLEADIDEEGERVMPSSLMRAVTQAREVSATAARLYSLILFGPPGTAKTTIATHLASVINYNFVTIDTATFLADGLESVASRMSYVFERLRSMRDTVILFDEIEEFCLDRENPSLAMESRMLTTAMLTQLAGLRRDQSNLFIVATNRLRSFDAAVIRPGRFDLLTFVGTPNFAAREQRLKRFLLTQMTSIGASLDDINKAMDLWSSVIKEDWEETLRFFTFAENEALNTDVLSLMKSGSLSEESLRARIADIEVTSTIQGPVRQEYIESEGLSRF
jgi:hypothetical protein